MRVKDLIAKLQELDPEGLIEVPDSNVETVFYGNVKIVDYWEGNTDYYLIGDFE